MHTYIERQNQQVNRRHIKITYLLTPPEPARGQHSITWAANTDVKTFLHSLFTARFYICNGFFIFTHTQLYFTTNVLANTWILNTP